MSEPETTPPRRPMRRPTRFPHRFSLALGHDEYDALCDAADAHEISVADLARDCIARGLPLVRDAQRRARRRERRHEQRP